MKNVIEPKVWRRVAVPASFSFAKFHLVIQAAFGWENDHLYSFSEKGYKSDFFIGIPSEWDDGETKNATKIKLQQVFTAPKQKFTYVYDFGDDWVHAITLEKILEEKALKATLIKGGGACPPEDCGGPWGYAQMKEILANPEHEEYAERAEWLGITAENPWNTGAFDFDGSAKFVSKI